MYYLVFMPFVIIFISRACTPYIPERRIRGENQMWVINGSEIALRDLINYN